MSKQNASGKQVIIDHFRDYLPLSNSDVSELESRFKEISIKRRDFILREGEVCKDYFFIVEGSLRMFKIDQNGKEHNLQFAIENQWITDIGSFHSEHPSALNIKAIESSSLLHISKSDLLYLFSYHEKFNRIFRVMVENAFVELQMRVLDNIGSSAEKRYHRFINDHPELVGRISNVQIASYIGVTPEFLSTIRKKRASS